MRRIIAGAVIYSIRARCIGQPDNGRRFDPAARSASLSSDLHDADPIDMTDKRTDQLPAAGPLDGNEIVAIDQAGHSRQASLGDIVGIQHDHEIADVAGLSAALASKMDAGAAVSPIGLHQIYIPAGAMRIRTTNGAAPGSVETATNKIMVDSLDFDKAVQEYAQFGLAMPKSWDEGSIYAKPIWTTTAAAGSVIWGFQAVARGDGDAIDAAWGAAQEVTDAVIGADLSHHAPTSAAIVIAGAPAEGDRVTVQVYRKAADAGDTLDADAKLLGVVIGLTTNAATDA